MTIKTARSRYAKFLISGLLGISLYIMSQSLSGGVSPQFTNNLWGRKSLITNFTALKLQMGDRVFQQALIGKDGWLEYTQEENLGSYENGTVISDAALEKTQRKLLQLYKTLSKRNITLLLVIAPNKSSIYPDKLPDGLQRIHPQSQLDAFTTYLQKHGPPILLDLRPALIAGRKESDTYYKTDTHWNMNGAFIAYTEIIQELSKTYPQLTPKGRSDFEITANPPTIHDIAETIGAKQLLESKTIFTPKEDDTRWLTINDDSPVPLQISIAPNTNLPSLLMYMDSFGNSTKKLIAAHFSRATFIIHHSKYPDSLSAEALDAIQPNILVIELVERSFEQGQLDNVLSQLTQKK